MVHVIKDRIRENTKIMLPCPFPMAGLIFAKTTSGPYWIYLEATSLPCAEGVRATPAMFDIVNPPTIEFNGDHGGYACLCADGASRYRLVGLKWRTNDTFVSPGAFLDMTPFPSGADGTGSWDWDTQRIDRFCVDRCWFRGGDRGIGQVVYQPISNAVFMQGTNHAVVDSYIDGICEGGTNFPLGNECHGILVEWTETFKIDNNYSEAASNCLFFGGLNGGPIGNGHRPTDGVVRRNFLERRLQWISTLPTWDGGGGRTIKNGLELKGGERILFEGNVLRRVSVQGGQDGQVWGVKCATGGATADLNGNGISLVWTRDITIRWNDAAEANMMLEMQGVNDVPWAGGVAPPGFVDATCVARLAFYHNRADRIGPWDGINRPQYIVETVHHHIYIGWNTVVPFSDSQANAPIFNHL